MTRTKLPDHLIAIALLVCAVAGCKQLQSLARPTILKSPDGKFQLTVPVGWRENSSLNAPTSHRRSCHGRCQSQSMETLPGSMKFKAKLRT